MSFARIAILVVITAVAVYMGLNLLLPHRKIEPTLDSGPTPDQVFNTNTSAAPAANADANPAAAPAATGSTSGDGKTLTEAEARKIAEEVGRKVGVQVAQQLLQQQSSRPAPVDTVAEPKVSDEDLRRIAQTEVHKAADAPSSDNAATEAEPAPVAAPKKIAKPKPARTAPVKAAAAEPQSRAAPSAKNSKAAPTTAIVAWWTPASQLGNGQFGLTFAGEAASERAIALLFSAAIGDAAAAGSRIRVVNAAGKPVGGQWVSAPNPRLLLFRVTASGRYTLSVGAEFADSQGRKLGSALHGAVDVH